MRAALLLVLALLAGCDRPPMPQTDVPGKAIPRVQEGQEGQERGGQESPAQR